MGPAGRKHGEVDRGGSGEKCCTKEEECRNMTIKPVVSPHKQTPEEGPLFKARRGKKEKKFV